MGEPLVRAPKEVCALHGVTPSAFGLLAARAFQNSPFSLSLVVLPEEKKLHRVMEDLEFFLNHSDLDTRSSFQASGIKHPASRAKDGSSSENPPSPSLSRPKNMEVDGRGWRAAPGEGGNSIQVLPFPELPTQSGRGQALRLDRQLDRIDALSRLSRLFPRKKICARHPAKVMLVTSLPAMAQSLPGRKAFSEAQIPLHAGMTCSFTGLIERLIALGYDHESEVASPGQFAVRGGIIDLYPFNERIPFRLDFFGDEIEEIRAFEPDTQRSAFAVKSLTVAPLLGETLPSVIGGILQYLQEKVLWQFWEPLLGEERFPQFFSDKEGELNLARLLRNRSGKGDAWLAYSALDRESSLFDASIPTVSLETEPLDHYSHFSFPASDSKHRESGIQPGSRLKFLHRLQNWQQEGYKLVLSVQSPGEMDRLNEIISSDPGLKSLSSIQRNGDTPACQAGRRVPRPTLVISNLSEGFRCRFPTDFDLDTRFWHSVPDSQHPSPNIRQPAASIRHREIGLVFATDSEIFGRSRKRLAMGKPRKIAQPQQVDQLLDFSELVEGDYLVHLQNGICLYRGLRRLKVGQGSCEVISLEFDEGITLHLPLHESHLVTRYVGLKKHRPKLGKVGTGRWEKIRRRAEEATLDFAARLLQNQASRDSMKGFACSPDGSWQRDFEAAFPYRETPDQLKAIVATKKDQEKPQPMDRLICGDVGFGKTEVAIRAAFKAVLDGKQVAILGPTTVLTQQHYNTFSQRNSSYPIVVEMLNRFRTRTQQAKILEDLAGGRIDIIVGTHRLLSRDVRFKDLGLIVIDEEHRFGVKHKERIKEYRLNADVLSLSATPIPRTLHLALMGARDLSVIETPPINRRPIETIIRHYDPDTVCEAISREVGRGGQVFYLHNRVQSICAVAARLEEMLPQVRFAVAHGQMHERTLERIMTRFVDGEYDVLVSTTIIESGLDIPNANTIIIEAANRFGLSQLYQIRGRVGRFDRQAYAYLLLHRHARLLNTARERLAAIKQYNQLGAGYRIALRDLELRGAGNLLGAEQSGHIAGVGFDLYCQLLKQSIARLKGDDAAMRIRATVQLDFVYMGESMAPQASFARDSYQALKQAEIEATRGRLMEACVPPGYLSEARLRIEVYRQLAMAQDLASIDALDRSLVDRYGPYPEPVKALLQVCKIRTLAEEKGIDRIESEGNRLKCRIAGTGKEDFIMPNNRFPRLSSKDPFAKLKEILRFLSHR